MITNFGANESSYATSY